MTTLAGILPDLLHYVDECGVDHFLYREYAYAPAGMPVRGKISGKKFKRTNIVSAKCGDKIIAPFVYDGITDSVLFEFWFEQMLLPAAPKGAVFVMDNATFHRKRRLQELAAQVG